MTNSSHVLDQINDRQAVAQVADTFRMVYTPFHGTGYQQIPMCWSSWASGTCTACRNRWSSTAPSPP
ncbi:MAG: hypothetical protein ACLR1T_16870 [Evtepia gabavorous]